MFRNTASVEMKRAARSALLGAMTAVAATSFWMGASPAQDAQQRAIKTCFEGKANKAYKGKVKASGDEFSRSLAAMAAGKLCHDIVASALRSCLSEIGERRDDPASYYGCIGIGANPCIESEWAADEFRKVVCADAEETYWLASLDADLQALRRRLTGAAQPQLDLMERSHFEHRDERCGLAQSVYRNNEPSMAYAACATEAAARTAIDLRILRIVLSEQDQKP